MFRVIVRLPHKSVLVNGSPRTVGGVSVEQFATHGEASTFRRDVMTDRRRSCPVSYAMSPRTNSGPIEPKTGDLHRERTELLTSRHIGYTLLPNPLGIIGR